MAQAYTPGLKVTPRAKHRARRLLPLPGTVLVQQGQAVRSRDVVAEALMPGPVTPLNMANLLSAAPADVPGCMLKKEGDAIRVGEPIARTRGMFGLFRSEYKSKAEGTIESISGVTGQVIVRGAPQAVRVRAYLTGAVTEVLPGEGCVIESDVCYVQAIFGVGGEAFGAIRMICRSPDQDLTPDLISGELRDRILVGGARVTGEAILKARELGAAAIVTGGLDDEDLRDFLGYDLGVAITGSEQAGLTLIITEGFGDIAMADRTYHLLAAHEGADAAVNGATQIRAGVMRPEVIVPLDRERLVDEPAADMESGALELERPVRIIRDPYFGRIGRVNRLPAEPQVLGSGSKARVLEVRLETGDTVLVPRANVELIEG
jgi:hypothetical protein